MKPETQKLLKKAGRALRAAKTLLSDGDADFAAGRALLRDVLCRRGIVTREKPAFAQAQRREFLEAARRFVAHGS